MHTHTALQSINADAHTPARIYISWKKKCLNALWWSGCSWHTSKCPQHRWPQRLSSSSYDNSHGTHHCDTMSMSRCALTSVNVEGDSLSNEMWLSLTSHSRTQYIPLHFTWYAVWAAIAIINPNVRWTTDQHELNQFDSVISFGFYLLRQQLIAKHLQVNVQRACITTEYNAITSVAHRPKYTLACWPHKRILRPFLLVLHGFSGCFLVRHRNIATAVQKKNCNIAPNGVQRN